MKRLLGLVVGLIFALPSMAAGLPSGYTELEYIQSDGNQIINTGYVVQETDSVEVDYVLTDLSRTGDKFIIGAQPISGDQTKGFWVETYDTTNTWYVRFGSSASANTYGSGATPSSQLSGTFIVSKNSFVVNGTKILEPNFTGMSTNPMTIFNRNSNDGSIGNYGASAQISEVRIKNGTNIVRKYIPARNSNNELGLYEITQGQFLTNQGTGAFTGGPVVVNTNANCKNLFDASVFNTSTTGSSLNILVYKVPNGTYTMSTPDFSIPIGSGATNVFFIAGKSGGSWGSSTNGVSSGQSRTITVTDGYYRVAYRSTYDTNTNNPKDFNWQIETGSTATAYTSCADTCPNGGVLQTYTSATGTVTQSPDPTPSAPVTPTFYTQGNMVLRKVGNIADSYDASTGKITRRVGIRTFNGSEDWNAYVSVPERGYYIGVGAGIPVKLGVSMENQGILSSHFKYYKWTNNTEPMPTNSIGLNINASNGSVTNGNMTIKPDTTAFPTVESWKTWLSSHPITVYYQLPEETTEDWPATQCESGNTCNNLFDKDQEYLHGYVDTTDGSFKKATGSTDVQRSFRIPCSPNTTYVLSGMTANSGWGSFTSDAVGTVATRYVTGNGTITTGANDRYLIGMAYAIGTQYDYRATLKVEQGETPTEYCAYRGKIKIATTKYNNTAFGPVVTALNNAVDTIKTVVANTINQATAVANLHSGKQTKPTDTCPNGKICLLVEDEAGTPHWYEIIERAPGIVPAGSGYTQVEYLQSDGNQWINMGVTSTSTTDIEMVAKTTAAGTQFLGGCFGTVDTDIIQIAQANASGKIIADLGNYNNNRIESGVSAQTDFRTMLIQGNDFYIDNVLKGTKPNAYRPDGGNCYIARNGLAGGAKAQYKSVKMWNDGVMVRDFVPARRNSDGVLGMYDTVSGNFFTNAGTGEFTAPNVLPAGYTRLQYLQSSGDAYIDTGVTLTSNYERVVAKFSAEEAFSRYGWRIFGSQNSNCSFVPWPVKDNTNPLGYLAVGKSWYLPKTQEDTISTKLHTPYEMDVTANNGNVSGTYCGYEFSSTYTGTVVNGLSITLFKNNGQAGSGSGGRIYYFKMWTSANTLAFDGVPAKNSNNEYGIYDFVSKEFKKNANNSGSLTGPVVQ